MKQSISSFFTYLRHPMVPQSIAPVNKTKLFLGLFLLVVAIDLPLGYLADSSYLSKIFQIANPDALSDHFFRMGIWLTLLVACIVAPIAEELLSRSGLTSFVGNLAILPISIGVILFCLFPITNTIAITTVAALAFMGSFVMDRLASNPKFKRSLLKWYSKNYGLCFYVTAIAFGAIHISNFKIDHFIPVLPILLVLPQLFAGLVLGYIRITIGLRYSMLMHGMHNLLCVLALFGSHYF